MFLILCLKIFQHSTDLFIQYVISVYLHSVFTHIVIFSIFGSFSCSAFRFYFLIFYLYVKIHLVMITANQWMMYFNIVH